MSERLRITSGDVTRIPFEELPANTAQNPYSRKGGYQSWAQTIRRISLLKADELQALYGDAIANLANYGNVTLRELVIVRAFYELVRDPNPAMLSLLMERDEGRIPQSIVSASGNIGDWMQYAKEQNIPIEEVLAEATKLLDEYNQPPTVVEGDIIE